MLSARQTHVFRSMVAGNNMKYAWALKDYPHLRFYRYEDY
jgi:hypothetical protein